MPDQLEPFRANGIDPDPTVFTQLHNQQGVLQTVCLVSACAELLAVYRHFGNRSNRYDGKLDFHLDDPEMTP